MNSSIFKAYDIRGIYKEELNEDDAYKIGLAFAKFTKAKNVLVGEDGRASSPSLRKALIDGISGAGANIVFAGQLTTPMFYFAVADTKNIDAGIMVTASHNPAKYNGFKLVWGDARPIQPSEIIHLVENPKLQIPSSKQIPNYKKISVADKYLKKLFSLIDVKKIKPMKIAIDAGNGMAGNILPQLLRRLPQIKAVPLFFDIDMTFPNHEANPLKEETLKDLKKSVLKNQAALGVAYDGDADRIGFVDEKGQSVRADLAFAALFPALLDQYPKSKILYDLRCSKIVPEEAARLGGKSGMTRVGHAFIKKQLQKEKAIAAAELSSHFYFKDFFDVECSDLVLLYLLLEISRQNKPLSKIIAPLQKYYQSGEINFEVKNKDGVISELLKKYKKQALSFTDLDGIRFEFKNGREFWWFSVRASNTEHLLRLNMEANNKQLLKEKLSEISKLILTA